MKARDFLTKLEHERIVAAIAEVEKRTSGEIRVFISQRHRPDGLAAARARFYRLRMHETPGRNAVLIYVAPVAQTFAVLGDEVAHEKFRDGFWHEVREAMGAEFRAGKFSEGIVRAVQLVGEELRRHFPHHRGDKNEQPDDIITD